MDAGGLAVAVGIAVVLVIRHRYDEFAGHWIWRRDSNSEVCRPVALLLFRLRRHSQSNAQDHGEDENPTGMFHGQHDTPWAKIGQMQKPQPHDRAFVRNAEKSRTGDLL